ncbi:MAG: MbnP family protein [Saprospiraceae bacterium]
MILIVAGLSSCKKDEPETNKTGDVTIEFDHVWAATESEFVLNKELTHPLLNEKMTFNIFKYYVSNVRLKAADGSWYAMPESYFIVDVDPAGSNKVVIPDVPGGEYVEVEMMFGVDSTRSTSGAQSGSLDPAKGMFWSWNSGYIMLKAEGTSPNSSSGSFTFHLGGFKGDNKVQTTKSYTFGTSNLVVDGDRDAEIHLIANPAKLWHAAESLAVINTNMMPNAIAKTMSSTFYDAIRFDHIHN